MGVEIERKFIVDKECWDKVLKPDGDIFKQGYIYSDSTKTIRIRLTSNKGFITIKGKSSDDGLSRSEFEYEIPQKDAAELLKQFTSSLIEKIRYKIFHEGFMWEIDVFEGNNSGLIIAEIELPNKEQSFKKPEWVGQEVTGDIHYYNSYLVDHPYKNWYN